MRRMQLFVNNRRAIAEPAVKAKRVVPRLQEVAVVVVGDRAGQLWTTRPPNTRSDHKRLPVVWNRSLRRNLDLTDLAVALTYDIVDFASDIALEAANGFELRVALADPPFNIRLCARVGSQPADGNNVQPHDPRHDSSDAG